jgi:hypothetical protein
VVLLFTNLKKVYDQSINTLDFTPLLLDSSVEGPSGSGRLMGVSVSYYGLKDQNTFHCALYLQ